MRKLRKIRRNVGSGDGNPLLVDLYSAHFYDWGKFRWAGPEIRFSFGVDLCINVPSILPDSQRSQFCAFFAPDNCPHY